MAHHLTTGRINVGLLREIARKDLLECLDKCQGSKMKAIVWDEKLLGPFGLIAEYALLKEHDVVKMYTLRSGALANADSRNIIFLVRPKLALMDLVADNILREEDRRGGQRKDFHIFFVPSRSMLCERRLEELGVYGAFTTIDEYCLELLPIDNDVVSLEMESVYKECHLEDDRTSLFHVARSLMKLQSLFGVIPNVYGKGDCAKHVFDLMMRMRRELAGNESQATPQIDNLVLIDRSVDLLTPLATQLTYEGLLDELFGIHNTTIKLPPEKFAKPGERDAQEIPTEPKQFILNSGEELYAELRDKNFNAVGKALSRQAKILSAKYDKRHVAKTVGDLKQFVTELPYMEAAKKSLANHTAMAELIKEKTDTESFLNNLQIEQDFINGIDTDKINPYIEDCIARQEPLSKVLKLICLQSVTNSGLKAKVLDYYRRELIQTYGYHHILTLRNLEKAGLLKPQGSKTYSTLRKTLKLFVENLNEQNPTDIAYVHSVYAPLSIRLVQFLANTGWRAITDALNLLPGPTVEEVQQIPIAWRKRRESGSSTQSNSEDQKVTLVFFLGGCTFAEISALRFLSQQNEASMEYVIATTKLINGTTFLNSLFEPLKPVTAQV